MFFLTKCVCVVLNNYSNVLQYALNKRDMHSNVGKKTRKPPHYSGSSLIQLQFLFKLLKTLKKYINSSSAVKKLHRSVFKNKMKHETSVKRFDIIMSVYELYNLLKGFNASLGSASSIQ